MSLHVFIAEDEPGNRELLAEQLGAQGFRVTAFANGAELLEALQDARPDAIVSDALMPVLDGFRLCLRLRRDPALCAIPFIVYTATYTGEDDAEFARRVGCDAFVLKPDQIDRLPGIIRETVSRLRSSPPRKAETEPPDQALLESYAQRSIRKLESKLLELHAAHAELRSSYSKIGDLNSKLEATVGSLRLEMDERRRVEEILQLAMRVVDMGAWSRDFAEGNTWVSPSALALLNMRADGKGITAEDLVRIAHPDDRKFVEQVLKQELGTDHDFDFEMRVLRPGNAEGHLQLRSEVFRSPEGRPLRRIGIVKDITARKKAQIESQALDQRLRQAQKMEALGTFAAGIAHDFNNILTVIHSHAELIACEDADPKSNSEEIINAARRARDFVDQILGFARQQKAPREPLDLRTPLAEAVRLLRASLAPQATLDHEPPDGPVMVSANNTQVLRLILNLGKNAIQAMAGRVPAILTIRLGIRPVDTAFALAHPPLRSGSAAVLTVSDTGVGMDAATISRIFEPFFTTKGLGGTGLGLALVHGIVAQHEGVVLVDSVPGTGTTFSVWLPMAAAPDIGEPEGRKTVPSAKGKRVLVVDDEPSVAAITVRLLAKLGYVAEALHDPVAARERILATPAAFDLVITDYLMPGLNGMDLAKSVWLAQPDLPFILIAGYGASIDTENVKEAGFETFVGKPFSIHQLKEACAAVFRSE